MGGGSLWYLLISPLPSPGRSPSSSLRQGASHTQTCVVAVAAAAVVVEAALVAVYLQTLSTR